MKRVNATMVTQIVTTPLCKDTGTTIWDLQNLFAWLEIFALVLVVAKVSFVIANLWCFMWVLYTSGQDSVPPSRIPGYHARFGTDRSDLKSRLLKVGRNLCIQLLYRRTSVQRSLSFFKETNSFFDLEANEKSTLNENDFSYNFCWGFSWEWCQIARKNGHLSLRNRRCFEPAIFFIRFIIAGFLWCYWNG